MTFPFNLMPADFRVPGVYTEVDNSRMLRGLSGIPTKLLLVGQRRTTGTIAALTPVRITSKDHGNAYFGAGSMLAAMCNRAFKINENANLDIWAIAQDDLLAGVAATGAITFGGPTTKAGTLNLYIGGQRIRLSVAAGTAANTIAASVVAAMALMPELPVSAVVDGVNNAKINLTARHKGEGGNGIDLRINYYADEFLPAGMTVTFTAMSGGTGNPDISAVFDVIADDWYTDFGIAYSDSANLAVIEEELNARFGPLQQRDGHACIGLSGTHGALITKGSARNNPHVSMIGAKAAPNPPYEWAAALAAIVAYEGKQDPARPLQTVEMLGILPPKSEDRFTLLERDLLLRNGISTFAVDAGGLVRVERIITTYRENPLGALDVSFLDIETLKTITYLRFDLRNHLSLMFPRFKIADDGTKFSRASNVTTPSRIRATIIARFLLWEQAGLVENVEQFKDDLIVERDANDTSRVNTLVAPDLINGLRQLANLIQPRL